MSNEAKVIRGEMANLMRENMRLKREIAAQKANVEELNEIFSGLLGEEDEETNESDGEAGE